MRINASCKVSTGAPAMFDDPFFRDAYIVKGSKLRSLLKMDAPLKGESWVQI